MISNSTKARLPKRQLKSEKLNITRRTKSEKDLYLIPIEILKSKVRSQLSQLLKLFTIKTSLLSQDQIFLPTLKTYLLPIL